MRIPLLLTSVFCLLTTSAPAALRTMPTQHYIIHTDLDTAFATDLAKRMDGMYAEYSRRMADFKSPAQSRPATPQEKLEVYLYTHKSDYDTLTEHKVPHTGGVFISGRDNFLASFLAEQGRDTMRKTLQHEAFHQFAYNTIARDLPIWLNEGMAEFFEEGIWDGNNFRIGEVPPWRVRQLQDDIKTVRLVDFDKFFAITQDQWQSRLTTDVTTGATEYNQAWAIVQFLVKGKHQAQLVAWLKAIHEGTPPDEAFKSSFPETPRQLQTQFLAWARTFQPTDRAMMIERQKILADMLVALQSRGEPISNFPQFRASAIDGHLRIRYTRGHVVWSTDENPAVYFTDRTGRLMPRDQLYFDPAPPGPGPLPDIVCRYPDVTLRAHFYKTGKDAESEILTAAGR